MFLVKRNPNDLFRKAYPSEDNLSTLHARAHDVDFFVSLLTEAADELPFLSHSLSGICRDPDEDLVLACAVETGCDFIVNGDKDLLVLKEYQDTKIVSPREFEMMFSD